MGIINFSITAYYSFYIQLLRLHFIDDLYHKIFPVWLNIILIFKFQNLDYTVHSM